MGLFHKFERVWLFLWGGGGGGWRDSKLYIWLREVDMKCMIQLDCSETLLGFWWDGREGGGGGGQRQYF